MGQVGSGKGTYASRISKAMDILHLSTGELLRQEIKNETEIGKRAKIFVEKADWSAKEIHDIIMELLKKEINKPEASNGFIFDGFPRTLDQAKDLEKITDIDTVINLNVPEKMLLDRITNRRTCKKCGTVYNLISVPPKKAGICDKCEGELYQRTDETEEMTKHRMEENDRCTNPVLEFYRNKGLVIEIVNDNPEALPNEVVERILDKLKKVKTE